MRLSLERSEVAVQKLEAENVSLKAKGVEVETLRVQLEALSAKEQEEDGMLRDLQHVHEDDVAKLAEEAARHEAAEAALQKRSRCAVM